MNQIIENIKSLNINATILSEGVYKVVLINGQKLMVFENGTIYRATKTGNLKKDEIGPAIRCHTCHDYTKITPAIKKAYAKLRCKPLFYLVPRGGIEPPTRGFSVPCSTN